MAGREAIGQISLFDYNMNLENIGETIAGIPLQRETAALKKDIPDDHLIDDEPIGVTPTGMALYRAESLDLMYSVDKKEIDFITEMKATFKKLNTEVLIMRTLLDSRDIFYIPKKTRLLVQPLNLKSKPYNADTVDRFFAVRNDIVKLHESRGKRKTIEIAYEPLERFSRRISIRKVDDDFSDPRDQSVNIAKDRKFFIPKKYFEGERYFNLTQAGVLDDFDSFCDFIKRSDSTAEKLR